jgi:protein SCO1/2
MVEAAKGKIGPSLNRLLAVCYSYDTKGNQFVFNVTRVSAIVITFIMLLVFIVLAFSRVKSKSRINR